MSKKKELWDMYDLLLPRQQAMIVDLVRMLSAGTAIVRNELSDFADENFALSFADRLLSHHLGSEIPLTKDKFEYAIVRSLNESGMTSRKLPNGNPGADIIVSDQRWSLKTQANRDIKRDFIHISKFMELGKGAWQTESDIRDLQQRMFRHMNGYDRIFTLRCFRLKSDGKTDYEYELVEIPKKLLLCSENFPVEIVNRSRQTPKPAYVHVFDSEGQKSFSLYFDGGTERKLQVKNLRKSLCIIHCQWKFTLGL